MLAPLLALSLGAAPALAPLPLPHGGAEIGFDDMGYAPALDRVLVPAGRTGELDLIDPASHAVRAIGGFSVGAPGERHGESTTSADFGHGLLFASDRTARTVNVVDPKAGKIVASAKLAAGPDYVRWIEPLGEVWVTEPRDKAIERFALDRGGSPKLIHAGTIHVSDGPESLVVDVARGRAYANSWRDQTYAIDLKQRAVVASWSNGCTGARGLALDSKRGVLFVACTEGKAVALDVAHGGQKLAEAPTGAGVDIIAYAPTLEHLYVPGEEAATLTILKFEGRALVPRGTLATAKGAHCVAADGRGGVYVCDPAHGQLLFMRDE